MKGTAWATRMAGAQLFVLEDEVQIVSGQALAYHIGTMADHHVDALWIKLSGAVDNMAEHRIAGNRVQDLSAGPNACGCPGQQRG